MIFAFQDTTWEEEKGVQLHTLLLSICFINKPATADTNTSNNHYKHQA